MARSQNGYQANDVNRTSVRRIPGTVREVRLAKGAPGWLLRDLAAWFDKHVETIDHDGILDDWGYAERPIRGGEDLSNHASGTALDLNAPEHPLGVRGTFTPAQAARIRERLEVYNGCIRWGGDYQYRADEMHFEIVRTRAACAAVRVKLQARAVAEKVTRVTRARDLIGKAREVAKTVRRKRLLSRMLKAGPKK